MANVNLKMKLVDILEIEDLLSTYHDTISSYKEQDDFNEKMRIAQCTRLEYVLDVIGKKIEGIRL